MLKLVLPDITHKDKVISYKEEFRKNCESMDGTAGLESAQSYEQWMKHIAENSNKETVKEGFVPATTFLAIRLEDNELVGMIDIRHELNEFLFDFGGNIGYSIRKGERRKGYATEMLKLALEECKKIGLDKVLLTCSKSNLGSAKTMVNNCAVLEREVKKWQDIIQRYWIVL